MDLKKTLLELICNNRYLKNFHIVSRTTLKFDRESFFSEKLSFYTSSKAALSFFRNEKPSAFFSQKQAILITRKCFKNYHSVKISKKGEQIVQLIISRMKPRCFTDQMFFLSLETYKNFSCCNCNIVCNTQKRPFYCKAESTPFASLLNHTTGK